MLSAATVKKVHGRTRRPDIKLEITEKTTFLKVINKSVIRKFLKDCLRRMGSSKASPNICKDESQKDL